MTSHELAKKLLELPDLPIYGVEPNPIVSYGPDETNPKYKSLLKQVKFDKVPDEIPKSNMIMLF